ncbi:MAG TPA: hypothetical protein VFR99_11630 [Marmoricola sp.]|nr:hypothetical protein [Marmoricola sp.]
MYDDPAGAAPDGADPAGDPELIQPEDFLPPNPFPIEAQRMGIDRWTGNDAALLAVAASLDPAKLSHRIVGWVLLVVVLTPVLLTLWQLLG